MHFGIYEIISFIIILLTALNIKFMSSPKTAVMGNRLGSAAMLGAIIMVLIHNNILSFPLLIISMLIGGVAGAVLATKTTTLKLPQLVATFNGFGGGASLLVSIIVITESHINLNFSNHIASFFAVIIGAVTLSGSIIAALKLDGRIEQKPVVIKGHNLLSLGSIVLFAVLIITSLIFKNHIIAIGITTAIIALLFGVLFTIRIGGADMPVVISLLNSYSGIAASICGFAINSLLLVSIGAVVGAAGFILTNIMCKAMNRSLINVLIGGRPISRQKPIKEPSKESVKKPVKESIKEPIKEVEKSEQPDESEIFTENSHVTALQNAEKVVIVPGYGMAVAQAQWKIKNIYETMEAKGIDVKFGIHPVAGRMPGHMNVLLAEVDIPYEKLYEMDQINPQFKETDVVIVAGACDVVNPAAVTAKDTPIYGMPILDVHNAANIIVCNMDTKPGYSGVDNPLYQQKNVTMLLGSADETLDTLNDMFQKPSKNDPAKKSEQQDKNKTTLEQTSHVTALQNAEKVIIVPGYGMAVAQAQWKIKNIYETMEAKGIDVKFGIHPVAGRMPGHMNVLLAEVDIPYEKLYEMDQINPQFKETDVVIVVGACDVVNPAAVTAKDTPIYGMPILEIHKAANIIVCNIDTKPGYSGVDNSLYQQKNVTMLLGSADETLDILNDNFKTV